MAATNRLMAKNKLNSRNVVPADGGGWNVHKPGASRASAHYDRQQDAINRARQILKNDCGGELNVHDKHGRIRQKDTIDRKDPYPPPG